MSGMIFVDGRVMLPGNGGGEQNILIRVWESSEDTALPSLGDASTGPDGYFTLNIPLYEQDDSDELRARFRHESLDEIHYVAYRNGRIVGDMTTADRRNLEIEIDAPEEVRNDDEQRQYNGRWQYGEGLQQLTGSLRRIEDTLSYGKSGSNNSSSSGETGTGSINDAVDNSFIGSLGAGGRSDDPLKVLKALEQKYPAEQTPDGKRKFSRVDRAFIVETDLNGIVTGSQRALRDTVAEIAKSIYPSINKLRAINVNADEERANAARNILRSNLEELVVEVGKSGGPRTARVNRLLTRIEEQRNILNSQYGFVTSNVTSVEEDEVLAEFVKIRTYISLLRTAWNDYVQDRSYLGTELTNVARALSAVVRSVKDANRAMDDYEFNSNEREVVLIFPDDDDEMTVADLMDWTERFATLTAPRDIRSGGTEGLRTILPEAEELQEYFRSITDVQDNPSHPALNRPAVRRAFGELENYFGNVLASINEVTGD